MKYRFFPFGLAIFLVLFTSTVYGTGPAITSFSPVSGIAGSSLTINGSGFNTTPANNFVFFGTVQGTVTSATANSLTVTVPDAAGYNYISVTNLTTGLTAYSSLQFITTCNDGSLQFDPFQYQQSFVGPCTMGIGDIDGDGKPDVVISFTNVVAVLRNTSTIGQVSYAQTVYFAVSAGSQSVSIADIDGDGKPDIVTAGYLDSSISVLRNTSVAGNVSFAPYDSVHINGYTYSATIADLDKDGKPEIIIEIDTAAAAVLPNTSVPGSISFASQINVALPGMYSFASAFGDIDGDGLPDMVVCNDTSTVSIYLNTSTPGSISFLLVDSINTVSIPDQVELGDMDLDGKADMLINSGSTYMLVWRNTSLPGNISFAPYDSIAATVNSNTYGIGDIDGDGKPDIVLTDYTQGFSILHNTSTTGNISFVSTLPSPDGFSTALVGIADMDGDGRADIIVNYSSSYPGPTVILQSRPCQGSLTGNGPFCTVGVTGQLTFTATTGTGPFTVIYNDGTANRTASNVTSGVPFNVFTQPLNATTTYRLVSVTDANDSVRTNGFLVDSAVIAVSPFISISGFSPSAGPVGTSVTITGSGFDPSPANNVVFFGSTLAPVATASTTQVTVTVPLGTTYQNITVTNLLTGSTATSGKPFDVTLNGNINFAQKRDFLTPNSPRYIFSSDIDGDGKADLIVSFTSSDSVYVYRNTSTAGNVNFARGLSIPSLSQNHISICDIDGDGKPDIVCAQSFIGGIGVLRNTSVPGSVSFESYPSLNGFSFQNTCQAIATGDIDGDGKPDVAVIVVGTPRNYLMLMHNTSRPGSVSFDLQDYTESPINSSIQWIALADIDQDNKPDLVAVSENGTGLIFLNTAGCDSSGFASIPDTFVSGLLNAEAVGIADLDGDGKPDLVAYSSIDTSVIYRNTSVPGALSFTRSVTIAGNSDYLGDGGTIADLDGDGKPDIAAFIGSLQIIGVFKNTSTTGNISFAPADTFSIGLCGQSMVAVDVDGDAKPDLAVVNGCSLTGVITFSILRQEPPQIPQGVLTANGPFCLSGAPDTAWLTFTASEGRAPFTIVYNDGVANRTATNILNGHPFKTFTNPITATTTYTLVSVSDMNDSVRTSGFAGDTATVLINIPQTVSDSIYISAGNATICAGNSVTFTAISVNGGTTPVYQWILNGYNQTNGPLFTPAGLHNNDSVWCRVTSNASCILSQTALSNKIKLTVLNHPAITITGDTDVCAGSNVVLSASSLGASISWQGGLSNGQSVLINNDTALVVMASLQGCITADTVKYTVLPERVWPGDANEDLVVNNYDILAIGLAYGAAGPLRPNASLTWQIQCTAAWPDSFSNGTNYAYADCNGDGIVDYADTSAVSLHYNLTHLRGSIERSGNIPLVIQTNGSQFEPGDTVTGQILLGTSAATANDVSGLAFTFDPGTAARHNSVQVNQSGSWLLWYGNSFAFGRQVSTTSVDMAQTRTDHTNQSGSGAVATFSFVLDSVATGSTITLTASAALCINNNGDTLGLNIVADSMVTVVNSINPVVGNNISVFPNPSNGMVFIQLTNRTAVTPAAEVYNPLGQVILSQVLSSNTNTIDLSAFASGVYVIKIQDGETLLQVKKICLVK